MNQLDEDIIAKRIKLVEKHLGESSDPQCRHCEWAVTAIGRHGPDCALRKIDPAKLLIMMGASKKELKKTMNRQRIWRGEVKVQGRGGEKKKTACRKRKRLHKKLPEEMKRCNVCFEERLFVLGECKTCHHARPCSWEWNERPCPICYPDKNTVRQNKKNH